MIGRANDAVHSQTKRIAGIPQRVLVVLLAAAPIAVYLFPDSPWPPVAAFGLYVLLASALDSWLIFCTLLGAMVGHALDPAVRNGTLESQAWQSAANLLTGTFAGVLVGCIADGVRQSFRSESPSGEDHRAGTRRHARDSR